MPTALLIADAIIIRRVKVASVDVTNAKTGLKVNSARDVNRGATVMQQPDKDVAGVTVTITEMKRGAFVM